MDERTLEVAVISAKGLKDVKHLRRMYPYVSTTVSGGTSQTTFKTPVDYEGGQNPVWRFSMKFMIMEKELLSNSLVLVFHIRCSRAVRGDKDVGDVHVPLKELLDESSNSDQLNTTTRQVRVPFSEPQGELTFSYAFGPQPQNIPADGDRVPHRVPAEPYVGSNAGDHQLQQGYNTSFIATVYTQTTETTTYVEPPLGYPPVGISQQHQVPLPVTIPTAYPPVVHNVLPFPPPNPTIAPPIATDAALVLSGIPGVTIDREKTEYELKLEDALSGLLQAIGSLEVEQNAT